MTKFTLALLKNVLLRSVQCNWWSVGRLAVDMLRRRGLPLGPSARKAVTEVHDGAGEVLALMRQTRMDEATIHCACMWAQGSALGLKGLEAWTQHPKSRDL